MSPENDKSPENNKPSLSAADQSPLNQKLADNIKQTLDKSLLDIDDETRLQLQRARQAALIPATYRKTHTHRVAWVTAAAAASIAAVVILPNFHMSSTPVPDIEDLSYLQVDPQALDDMDMLLVMGELDGDV